MIHQVPRLTAFFRAFFFSAVGCDDPSGLRAQLHLGVLGAPCQVESYRIFLLGGSEVFRCYGKSSGLEGQAFLHFNTANSRPGREGTDSCTDTNSLGWIPRPVAIGQLRAQSAKLWAFGPQGTLTKLT